MIPEWCRRVNSFSVFTQRNYYHGKIYIHNCKIFFQYLQRLLFASCGFIYGVDSDESRKQWIYMDQFRPTLERLRFCFWLELRLEVGWRQFCSLRLPWSYRVQENHYSDLCYKQPPFPRNPADLVVYCHNKLYIYIYNNYYTHIKCEAPF